jgi:hypothetical protein
LFLSGKEQQIFIYKSISITLQNIQYLMADSKGSFLNVPASLLPPKEHDDVAAPVIVC